MKQFKKLILVLSLLLPAISWAGSATPLTFKTNNGVSVYLVRRHRIPMVDIAVVFAAGSVRDGDQWGVANLAQNLMGHGTRSYSEKDISDVMADTGAILHSQLTRDMSVWTLRSLTDARKLRRSVGVLQSILAQPAFPQPVLQRIKDQTRIQILNAQQNPVTLAKNAFFSALYKDQGYGHPRLGTQVSVAKLTVADCRHFYQRYYHANNAFVVLVGDLSVEHAKRIANQLTKGLRTGPAVAPVAPVMQANKAQVYLPLRKAQTTLVMGQVGFAPFSPGYYARMVGNDVLGGAGLSSLLALEVREKRGLAYNAKSELTKLQGNGPLVMISQSRSRNVRKTYLTMLHTYQQFLQHGVTPAQLAAAKASLSGRYLLANVSNDSLLSNIITQVFYHYPLDYFDTFAKRIQQVSNSDIKTAFAALRKKPLVAVMVGRVNAFKTPNKKHRS